MDVGPKCTLPGEGKPRGISVQENLIRLRAWAKDEDLEIRNSDLRI